MFHVITTGQNMINLFTLPTVPMFNPNVTNRLLNYIRIHSCIDRKTKYQSATKRLNQKGKIKDAATTNQGANYKIIESQPKGAARNN